VLRSAIMPGVGLSLAAAPGPPAGAADAGTGVVVAPGVDTHVGAIGGASPRGGLSAARRGGDGIAAGAAALTAAPPTENA